MLIIDVETQKDCQGVHKCAEEEEGERRVWRISQASRVIYSWKTAVAAEGR